MLLSTSITHTYSHIDYSVAIGISSLKFGPSHDWILGPLLPSGPMSSPASSTYTCPSAWASSSAARMCLLSASPARWSIKGHCVPPGHCIDRVTKLITRPHTYHPLIHIVGSLSLSICNMLVCSHGLSHCVRRCVKHACHAQCSVDQVQTCSDVRVITDLYVIE